MRNETEDHDPVELPKYMQLLCIKTKERNES